MFKLRNIPTRQGVLTVGFRVAGSVLDALQRCIDLQHVSDVLCALHFEVIPRDTANEGAYAVSGGADGRIGLIGQRTPGS